MTRTSQVSQRWRDVMNVLTFRISWRLACLHLRDLDSHCKGTDLQSPFYKIDPNTRKKNRLVQTKKIGLRFFFEKVFQVGSDPFCFFSRLEAIENGGDGQRHQG